MIRNVRRATAEVPEVSDSEILSSIASGDFALLGTLYDRYGTQLRRLAQRIAGDAEAADIVHTAFLRVVDLADTYDTTVKSARPWLYSVVIKVAQEHRRSLRRRAKAMLGFAFQPRRPATSIEEARPDLDQCLSKLSEPKRIVLLLVEVDGFTCEEVATMLTIPIGTVWTRLFHARRELRSAYVGSDP